MGRRDLDTTSADELASSARWCGGNGLFIFGGSDGAALLGEGWSWVVSSWSENIGPDVPNGVYGAALAYDSALSKVIYFGSNSTTELWTWDGLHWRDVSAPGMLPRSYAAVSFDDARSRLVVFGGYDGRNELGDTIEWDGAQWITMTPDHSPTARHGASMVYDPVRAVTVLFGGSDTQGNYSDDTWQWDGTDWVPEAATSGSPWPNARWFASMAYDATLGVVVMWSGGSTVEFHDTWQWDGSTWTQTSSSAPGVVSSQFNLAYNTHLGLDIGVVDGATYSWNGAAWTQLVANPGPPQVQSYAVAYDASRFRLIEIGGGNNDNAPTVWSVTDPFLPAPGGP